jgi:ketosteroid isomerase-like protein
MTNATSDEGKIRHLVERWAEAVRARDMDGAVAHHTNDIVMFDVPMPLMVKGIDDYRKTWELFFENMFAGPRSFELTDLQIMAGESVAFAYSLLHIGGSQEPVGRLTLGFRKVSGEWLIAHEHHSYPVE